MGLLSAIIPGVISLGASLLGGDDDEQQSTVAPTDPHIPAMMQNFFQNYYGTTKEGMTERANLESQLATAKVSKAGALSALQNLSERIQIAEAQGNTSVVDGLRRQLVSLQSAYSSAEYKVKSLEAQIGAFGEEPMKETYRLSEEDISRAGDELVQATESTYGAGSENQNLLGSLINKTMGGGNYGPGQSYLDKLMTGINFGFGGQKMGSFLPKGNAAALASLPNILQQLTSTIGTKAQGLVTPAQTEMQLTTAYPEGWGTREALQNELNNYLATIGVSPYKQTTSTYDPGSSGEYTQIGDSLSKLVGDIFENWGT